MITRYLRQPVNCVKNRKTYTQSRESCCRDPDDDVCRVVHVRPSVSMNLNIDTIWFSVKTFIDVYSYVRDFSQEKDK